MMLRIACILGIAGLLIACNGAVHDPGPAKVVAVTADSTKARAAIDGQQEIHTADGGRMTGMVVNGQREGQWTAFFANGMIRSRATYKAGKRTGNVEVFHDNGMPYYTGQYQDEVKVGTWVFFDLDGKELKRVTYDSMGVPVEVK
jgi:hypothetical protein